MYTTRFLSETGGELMATKPKKKATASNSRESLAEDVAAFLKAGGKIQQIDTGKSGQTTTSGPRQIVLSHKSNS